MLCEKLAKMAKETTIWDEFVDPALMVYYTTKHMTMGVIPFLLIYGREAILPIDEPHKKPHDANCGRSSPYKGRGMTHDSVFSTTHDRK